MLCEKKFKDRDVGMTLPEVVIAMTVAGIICVVLASSVMVILRQNDNSKGRLNNARSEQSVNIWMPQDLASAEKIDVSPGASPCNKTCPSGTSLDGSNSIMLTWSTLKAGSTAAVSSTTSVSYRYRKVADEYQMIRIKCETPAGGATTCKTIIVLHDLEAPPDGTSFTAGVTAPTWAMQVSQPLAPDEIADPNAVTQNPAQDPATLGRVVVSINGRGDSDGNGGGRQQFSISAGATTHQTISANSLNGTPTFTQALSRCGGPIALVIDNSGSIGSTAMAQVNAGVQQFIDNVAGTPVQLEVIAFSDKSKVIGATSGTWQKYFDMLVPADVSSLRTAVASMVSSGGTNWEDGLYRTFYNLDGTTPVILPQTTVFFTDGVPNVTRQSSPASTYSSTGTTPATPVAKYVYPTDSTGDFDMEGFYRADNLATMNRSSSRFIGVLVGAAASQSSVWVNSTTLSYQLYQVYEIKSGTKWKTATLTQYNATSTANRRLTTVSSSTWSSTASDSRVMTNTTLATYNATASTSRRIIYGDTVTMPNSSILAKLVSGGGNTSATTTGVPAEYTNGAYTNAKVANMYVLPNWSQFAAALEAVALSECGGTLTLQTKVGSSPAADPFTYQHTKITNSSGVTTPADLRTVTTTQQFVSGTFDFSIPNGEYVTVEVQPTNLSGLNGYKPISWTCKAANQPRTVTTFATGSGAWTGIRVKVAANEAVSCIQTVERI